MATDLASSRAFSAKRALFVGAVVVTLSLLPTRPGVAHILPEQRQAILSLSPDRIELLVNYEQPAGVRALELRDIIDMDRNGAVESPLEQLAEAQLLLPRLRAGLEVTVDGVAVPLTLERLSFRDGAGEGRQAGFEGIALFRADYGFEANRETQVSLRIAEDTPPTRAEVQVLAGLELVSSALPAAPDAPIVGPAEVLPALPLTVTVRRQPVL